ncbi:hypothetical protein Tco_0606278 [Tanacetum coccineum]
MLGNSYRIWVRFAKPPEKRANIDMRFPKIISEDQSQDFEREVSKQEIKTAFGAVATKQIQGLTGFLLAVIAFLAVIEHDVLYGCVNGVLDSVAISFSKGSIFFNRCHTSEFPQFYKGLKQGDPLSPFSLSRDGEPSIIFQRIGSGVTVISPLDSRFENAFFLLGLKINLYKSMRMGFNVESALGHSTAAAIVGGLVLKCPFSILGTRVEVLWTRVKHGKR